MFIGLEHTAIASPNPEKLAHWYVDNLGFHINFSYAGNFFVKAANGSIIEIIPAEGSRPPQVMENNKNPGIRHLAIAVSDFEAAYHHLKSLKVNFLVEPFDLGANRLVFFNDGDGNLVHLIKREKPLRSEPNRVLRRTFKAFEYRDFRLLWLGACTSSIGTWMQEVAQNWLVLTLTNSPFLLGVDAFLGDIPIFLFSLVGGVIADRMDRRKLLMISQIIQMVSALTLAALIATHRIQVWHILLSSFVVGTAQAFGGPAYSALVPSLVEKEDLQNAIGLNSIQFNLGRVVGPVLGGLAFRYVGAVWCFGLNAVSFLAVITSLLMLNINFKPPRTGDSILTGIKQGFGFIRKQAGLEMLVVIAFCMTWLTIPMITFLPVFAKNVFNRTELTYTLFLVTSGLGSITGALTVAALGNVKNKGRVALAMLMALGAGITGFSLSQSIPLSCVLLFFSGGVMMCAFAMISSLVQLITPNEMRGRVMSVYNVAFRGGMPFGSITTGRLVPIFTAPTVLSVNGLLLLTLGAYFLFVQKRVAEL